MKRKITSAAFVAAGTIALVLASAPAQAAIDWM